MAGTLTFDLARVRAEIAKAKAATSHNQSLVGDGEVIDDNTRNYDRLAKLIPFVGQTTPLVPR